MQWNDQAIVLSVRRMGERSGIVHLLTLEHGLHAGVDASAFGKTKRGLYEPGNIVDAHWQARLSEHIGMLRCELQSSVAAHLLTHKLALSTLTAATQMIERTLVERDAQPAIYRQFQSLIATLLHGSESQWLCAYVRLECALLEHTGFGLDLEQCAATGKSEELVYVSPKSGRAVSRDAGLPYHERLFTLPEFLKHGENSEAAIDDVRQGLRLCGYFLQERILTPRQKTLPSARARMLEMI